MVPCNTAAAARPAASAESGRYEFRIFGTGLDPIPRMLCAIGGTGRLEASLDRYLIVPGVADASLKVRDRTLDLKTLCGTSGPLERWQADTQVVLPADPEQVRSVLIRAGVADNPGSGFADTSEILDWLVRKGFAVVPVRKLRRRYFLPGALGEHADLVIGERHLATLAIEGESPEVLTGLIRRLGLRGMQNTSYPRLLRALAV